MIIIVEKCLEGMGNSSILTALIAFGGVVFSVVFSSLSTYLLNKKTILEEANIDKKRLCYDAFLQEFTKRVTTESEEERNDKLVYTYESMKLWASDDVLVSIKDAVDFLTGQSPKKIELQNDLRDGVIEKDEYNDEFDKRIMKKYYRMITIMRNDLKVSTNFKINEDNISLIK